MAVVIRPPAGRIRAGFASFPVKPLDVSPQHEDLFLYSGHLRPRLYPDPAVHANISSFVTLCEPADPGDSR